MIVDGGLGVELAERGFRFTTRLWSGEAVLSRPELLCAIHRAYLEAGADVLATATYQLAHGTLRELGYSEAGIDDVFARAVQLARDAIAARPARPGTSAAPLVAGSLGPYGATLGDGSEYSGKQHLGRDALYAFHLERTRALVRAQPDLLLFETIPTLSEGLVLAEVARDLDLERVWLSFCCGDGAHTYGGDRISDVGTALDRFAGVEVVGINCTAPDNIAPLVTALRSATAKPILVCPNLGQQWDTESRTLTAGAADADVARRVPEWLDLGVTHVGGCCGAGPSTIAAIARAHSAAS